MTPEQVSNAMRELEALKAENQRLQNLVEKVKQEQVSITTGQRGGVCIKIPGRNFPVSAYKEQWPYILDNADRIRAYIEKHQAELKTAKEAFALYGKATHLEG